MLSIQQIEYILALDFTRHFQKASDKCFVTQPTLSMQIKKAEEELGYGIFDRSRSPVKLTTFGEALMPILRDTIHEYEKIGKLVNNRKGTYLEQINVGIIPTVGSYLIPELFSKWQKKIKNVKLVIEEMKTEELLLALDRKELDLAIMAGPMSDHKYRTTVLYDEEIMAYIPNLQTDRISATELENMHPWLLSKGNCLRTQMIHFCGLKKDETSLSWDYEGGNLELLIKMVDMNGGYTLVPENFVQNTSASFKRIINTKTKESPARQIIALSQSKSPKWESLEAIIREIQFNFGNKVTKKGMKILSWK
jgi:LysR family transcriptional regulator, hydrogen peroxide-inducible genes activator